MRKVCDKILVNSLNASNIKKYCDNWYTRLIKRKKCCEKDKKTEICVNIFRIWGYFVIGSDAWVHTGSKSLKR